MAYTVCINPKHPPQVTIMNEYKHYTKNTRHRVSRSEYFGAQRAAHKESQKQLPRESNCQGGEQGGRKCHNCGIILLKPETYIIDWINQDLQAVCMDCYTGRR